LGFGEGESDRLLDKDNHLEYFMKVKPKIIEIQELWLPVLKKMAVKDERDFKSLDVICHNIVHSEDMIDLVWYATLLFNVVRSIYNDHGMKLDGSGKQFWNLLKVS